MARGHGRQMVNNTIAAGRSCQLVAEVSKPGLSPISPPSPRFGAVAPKLGAEADKSAGAGEFKGLLVIGRSAGLETRDTAGWKTCATVPFLTLKVRNRPPNKYARAPAAKKMNPTGPLAKKARPSHKAERESIPNFPLLSHFTRNSTARVEKKAHGRSSMARRPRT